MRATSAEARALAALLSDEAYQALVWHATGKPARHPLWKAVRAAETLRGKGERA